MSSSTYVEVAKLGGAHIEVVGSSMNYRSPDCPYAANESFSLSGYHPTYPMHNLTVEQIVYGLQYRGARRFNGL